MEQAFKKLQSIFGGIVYTDSKGKKEIVIHFSNVKFVLYNGIVVCKDKDYWDFQEARIICNPRYLKRMEDIIMMLPRRQMIKYRHKNIFKKHIRGMCKFGDHLHLNVTDEQKKNMGIELMVKSVKEVAMKFNVSENFCKQLLKK